MRPNDVDLFDPETQEDWYPAYDVLREQARVYRIPGTSTYVLTRYEDVLHVIRNTDVFPNGMKGEERLLAHEEAWAIYNDEGYGRVSPISSDPPVHRKYRSLIDSRFTVDAATQVRPRMTEIAHSLIDGFADRGEVEFLSEFCLPLPVQVITEVLGLPIEDIPKLKHWSEVWVMPFARGLTEEQELHVARTGVEFQRYLKERLDDKRENPGDDVMSHLATARFDGERPLTDGEIINMIEHLYIGGNETTTFALSSGMWLLLSQPGLYEAIVADRSLLPNFVEEVLRFESPTMGLYRTAAVDTEIGGVPIPAGSTIHIRFAAANRDPRMFEEPAAFDPTRRNAWRHMAFSLGEHHCPGAGLSRVEQRAAWEAILDRLPNLRLAPGKNDFRHRPGFVLRALHELHICFDPS